MNISEAHDIGSLGDLVRAGAVATATAGGSGDATTVTGSTIDREGFAGGSLPRSALFGVAFSATQTSSKTLSFAFAVQDSPDGTNWSDYSTTSSVVADTGLTGGTTHTGQLNLKVDLNSARRYVRFNYKPTHSATQTDTSVSFPQAFLAGFDRLASPAN